MRLKDAWWYESLLCMPDVPDDVIHFFGRRFPPTPGEGRLGMPAPVCVRLFIRHLRAHPDATPQDVLEILSYVEGLTTLFADQFRRGMDLAAVKPDKELTLEALTLVLISRLAEMLGSGLLLSRASIEDHVQSILDSCPLVPLRGTSLVTKREDEIWELVQMHGKNDLYAALRAYFPNEKLQQKLLHYANTAWKALGRNQLEVVETDIEEDRYVPSELTYGEFHAAAVAALHSSPHIGDAQQHEAAVRMSNRSAFVKPAPALLAMQPQGAAQMSPGDHLNKRRKESPIPMTREEAGVAGALLNLEKSVDLRGQFSRDVGVRPKIETENEAWERPLHTSQHAEESDKIEASSSEESMGEPTGRLLRSRREKYDSTGYESPDFSNLHLQGEANLGSASSSRRKVGRWTQEETDLLVELTYKHGKGHWKKILEASGDILIHRSQVDLKDKWRNLEKQGLVPKDLPTTPVNSDEL